VPQRQRYNHDLTQEAALTINSMTAYARSQDQDGQGSWVWEVKSVNGKGLELRTRLPPGYDQLDLPVREQLQKKFRRGSLSASLSLAPGAESAAILINEAVLTRYIALAQRCQDLDPDLAPARIDGLLALRGVLETADSATDPNDREKRGKNILASLETALEALASMRAAEGRRLTQVLEAQLAEIHALVQRAESSAALDPQAIKDRLRQQIQALLETVPAIAEDRLAQEAALLVQKADVREELDRLKAHLEAARDMLASKEAVGRRLDFLCQEFNREANTLCSKAADVSLTRIGMDLKAVIEQFREQVQNIE